MNTACRTHTACSEDSDGAQKSRSIALAREAKAGKNARARAHHAANGAMGSRPTIVDRQSPLHSEKSWTAAHLERREKGVRGVIVVDVADSPTQRT